MNRRATDVVPALSASFTTTRDALRALACYVIAPARKARTGHIGLRPTGDGFGTPPFDDGTQIVVDGDRLRCGPGESIAITTLAAGASFVGIELSPDPGVGHDLPPFTPESHLDVDGDASRALGAWYAFGDRLLRPLGEAQLWPEHFDLAVAFELDNGVGVNIGVSPGDAFHEEPYVYVGPHDTAGLTGDFWNAPFGAVLTHEELRTAPAPHAHATTFITHGVDLLKRFASD